MLQNILHHSSTNLYYIKMYVDQITLRKFKVRQMMFASIRKSI